MGIFQKFDITTLSKSIQGQSRNRATLNFLKAAGFSMPGIRGALLRLNDIHVTELVDGHQLSAATLYAVVSGARRNRLAHMIVADALGFHVPELFPDDETGSGPAC